MHGLPQDDAPRVRVRTRAEGSAFDLLGARFLTKAGAREMNGAFCVVEMMLPTGAGIPLHHHPFPEFFYVLAGAIDFGRLDDGRERWARAEAGESVLVSAGALHGLKNESDADARLLVVVTHRHELFFLEAGTVGDAANLPRPATAEELTRVTKTAARYETFLHKAAQEAGVPTPA
jgi:quercetin dioxygenase-like cupin family protein